MSWIGAVLDCRIAPQGTKFGLTLKNAGKTWEAIDPKGLLTASNGIYDSLGICVLSAGGEGVVATLVGLDGIFEDNSGAGSLYDGQSFTWLIETVVDDA